MVFCLFCCPTSLLLNEFNVTVLLHPVLRIHPVHSSTQKERLTQKDVTPKNFPLLWKVVVFEVCNLGVKGWRFPLWFAPFFLCPKKKNNKTRFPLIFTSSYLAKYSRPSVRGRASCASPPPALFFTILSVLQNTYRKFCIFTVIWCYRSAVGDMSTTCQVHVNIGRVCHFPL